MCSECDLQSENIRFLAVTTHLFCSRLELEYFIVSPKLSVIVESVFLKIERLKELLDGLQCFTVGLLESQGWPDLSMCWRISMSLSKALRLFNNDTS
jgi:hypothetical protein